MRAVLVDIDVILDVLAKREPFVGPAARLWAMVERKVVRGYLASHSITTLYYLIRKSKGKRASKGYVRDLLAVFEIAPVNRSTLLLALEADIPDFEDAVQYAAARQVNADFIITRNIKDYAKADIPVAGPEIFLATSELV